MAEEPCEKPAERQGCALDQEHGKSFYGYKNHVNVDAKHKLIRRYEVTDASVHDGRKFYRLVNKANTSADVYADSAYRSAVTEASSRCAACAVAFISVRAAIMRYRKPRRTRTTTRARFGLALSTFLVLSKH